MWPETTIRTAERSRPRTAACSVALSGASTGPSDPSRMRGARPQIGLVGEIQPGRRARSGESARSWAERRPRPPPARGCRRRNQILLEWDPYTFSILTEVTGAVHFKDLGGRPDHAGTGGRSHRHVAARGGGFTGRETKSGNSPRVRHDCLWQAPNGRSQAPLDERWSGNLHRHARHRLHMVLVHSRSCSRPSPPCWASAAPTDAERPPSPAPPPRIGLASSARPSTTRARPFADAKPRAGRPDARVGRHGQVVRRGCATPRSQVRLLVPPPVVPTASSAGRRPVPHPLATALGHPPGVLSASLGRLG